MRKTVVTLKKGLYLLLTEIIALYLVAFPVYAFQVSSSSTGYVRVATASAISAYQVAQRAAFTSAVASAISAPTVASVAVRLATGPVGWGLLGVSAALILASLYYSSQEVWLYVSGSGLILKDDEIAIVSGGIVNARMDRGVRILFGSWVLWGGAASRQRHQVRWCCLLPPWPQWEQRSGHRWRRLFRCLLATEPRICWPRLRGCSRRHRTYAKRDAWIKQRLMPWCIGRGRASWEALRWASS